MSRKKSMTIAELTASNTVRGFTIAILIAILKSHVVSVNVETAWVDLLLDVIQAGGGVLGVVGLRQAITKNGPIPPDKE